MVDQALEDDDIGIDLDSYKQEKEEAVEDTFIDLDQYAQQQKEANEIGWTETIGDWLTQAGRGALKAFTWPADVLKIAMIGEGLSDIDELEQAFNKAGKPFDREGYVRSVFEQSRYIPTQELLEQGLEELTGISLQPKTEGGRRIKQGAEIASFARGGALGKLASAGVGVGTTEALKQSGVEQEKAELVGDLASLSPAALEKSAKNIPKSAESLAKTAQKHALPFKEFMVKEREPFLKGRLFKNTEANLKEQFNISAKQALNRIVEGEIPIRKLRNKGINLNALSEHAYDVTERLAQAKPQVINTEEIVKNIDKEVARIKNLAPSPSDAQKEAVNLLERERDVLKVAKPNSEQLVNQHKNYNSDAKAIYLKPEFRGKDEQLRKAYAFLNNELVEAMVKQGSPDVANAFKAANKIFHEKSKLAQTESILGKAFDGDSYSPKKLEKLLHSKQGNFLRRNMSESAVKDLEDIANFGKESEQKMAKFIDLRSPSVTNEIKSWGQLAPFIFLPHNLKGASILLVKPLAKHIQGKLLTRNATREAYKLTLKHSAEGSFNLLKKDFANLEKEIGKEWGSVDDFIDDMMSELEIYESE